MELDGEEITPLKRRRKKKEKDSLSDADSIKASKEAAEKNQLTPTKKKNSKTKYIAFISPAKESPCKNLEKKITTIDNPESFKGVFCSSNNKPDMMFFKPRDSEDVTRDKLIHCPICHINLQFLHGTTPQCHINQCLDSQPDFEQRYCSGDSSCSLTNIQHFRTHRHQYEKLIPSKDDCIELKDEAIKNVVEVEEKEELQDPKKPSKNFSTFQSNHTRSPGKQTCINDFFGGKKPPLKPNNLFGGYRGGGNSKITTPSSQTTVTKTKTPRPVKNARKECPFYKKIPGTNFTVDAFRYGDIDGCSCYFLTHFHSDHYGGLKKSFNQKLYCSQITANLVMSQINVSPQFIHVLPMDQTTEVEGVKITLLDANHCPGAVMFLMELPSSKRILHVGDFRAHPSMLKVPPLACCGGGVGLPSFTIDALYLDTTYCNPNYTFPPQDQVVDFVVETALRHLKENPRTLIACGTYSIGKEKVFQAIADDLDCKVAVSPNKMKLLKCLCDVELEARLTLDFNSAGLHVLPMNQLTIKSLQEHLSNHKSPRGWERILAFKPTGWTYSDKLGSSLDNIQPIRRPDVTIFGVPYSEHSSFEELGEFVRGLKPKKIIPTVNMGRKESRDKMNEYFSEWMNTK